MLPGIAYSSKFKLKKPISKWYSCKRLYIACFNRRSQLNKIALIRWIGIIKKD
jgi:hypothetical protein